MNRLFAMLGLLVLSVLVPARADVPQYVIHVLDIPGIYSSVLGINNQGHAVGLYYTEYPSSRAFYWDGAFHDLGPGVARAINNHGVVVGHDPKGREMSWYWDGGFHPVVRGYAIDISDTGYIVGQDYPGYQAYRWKDGIKIPLGYLGSGTSTATAVNDQGVVVGEADVGPAFPGQAWHAFLWDGQMHDLGTYGGAKYGSLFGINSSGIAVGESFSDDAPYFAVRYDGAFQALPLWTAAAINEAGTIVGSMVIGATTAGALLTTAGQLVGLPGLGGRSAAAHAVSDSGWIGGIAIDTAGVERAVIWEPVPEPSGLMTMILLSGALIRRPPNAGRRKGAGVRPSPSASPS